MKSDIVFCFLPFLGPNSGSKVFKLKKANIKQINVGSTHDGLGSLGSARDERRDDSAIVGAANATAAAATSGADAAPAAADAAEFVAVVIAGRVVVRGQRS